MNKLYIAVFAVILIACQTNSNLNKSTLITPKLSNNTNCLVPAAIPNDGLDDTIAINNALATQGCAQLAGGVYNFTTPAYPRAIYDLQIGSGQSIIGAGSATVLAFAGNAEGHDLYAIQLTGSDPSISNLSINTANITNGSDEMHAVQITGPATSVKIDNVYFNHMPISGTGDCVKLVGYSPSQEISGVNITHNEFLSCSRGGIDSHSSAHDIRIINNGFYGVVQDDITAQDGSDMSDWIIASNILTECSNAGSGAPSCGNGIAIDFVNDLSIVDNVINGRSISLYDVVGVTMTGNTDLAPFQLAGQPNISLEAVTTNGAITGNYFVRLSTSGAAPVIEIEDHGTALLPGHIVIGPNEIIQATEAAAIVSQSTSNVTITGNDISVASTTGLQSAIFIDGVNARANDILVAINNIHGGSLLSAVRISGSYQGMGRISAIGNLADGTNEGLRCENQTGITGPVVSTANNWPANVCATTSGQ